MKTSKLIAINVITAILLIVTYRIIPLNFALSNVSAAVATAISVVFDILFYILFFSVLILAFEKNKCVFSKPLFDKNLPIARRFSLIKLFLVCALQLAYDFGTTFLYSLMSALGTFGLQAFYGMFKLFYWIVIYLIIVKGCHNLFASLKYRRLTLLTVIPTTIIGIVINTIGATVIANLILKCENYVDASLKTLSYLKMVNVVDLIIEIVIISSFIVFHGISLQNTDNK